MFMVTCDFQLIASTAMFNHVGDGIVLTHQSEHSIRLVEFPSLAIIHAMPTHVGGCVAAALDPRGKLVNDALCGGA